MCVGHLLCSVGGLKDIETQTQTEMLENEGTCMNGLEDGAMCPEAVIQQSDCGLHPAVLTQAY